MRRTENSSDLFQADLVYLYSFGGPEENRIYILSDSIFL
jgi:hypothetical protein